MLQKLQQDAIELLKTLIKTESFSKEEHNTADILNTFLVERGVETIRLGIQ